MKITKGECALIYSAAVLLDRYYDEKRWDTPHTAGEMIHLRETFEQLFKLADKIAKQNDEDYKKEFPEFS